MKKKAMVWQFFDKTILENGITSGVVCKLCRKSFKHHGNTTNLRSHISRVHPIQWDLATDGVLDEDSIRKSIIDEGTDNDEAVESARALLKRFRGSNSNDDDQTEFITEDDHNMDAVHIVQQSDEEWLDDMSSFRTNKRQKKKQPKSRRIKREVLSPEPFPSLPNFDERQIIVASDSTPKDEYSVFGEYIANKLRKFKSSRTRGNLQQLITTILWQAEYGYFDSTEAVKKVIQSSVENLEHAQMQSLHHNEIPLEESVIGN